MSSTRQELLDMITDPDTAYNQPAAELIPKQLRAAQELFRERRGQISLLGRRADDAGVSEIRTLDDLVPLLFAHTSYKSYPSSYVEQGRWDRMLRWMQTLSVAEVTNVDVSGVNNVDDWLERLWDNGHMVLATSGSSGKCSFLNHTRGDRERKKRHFKYSVGWPFARSSPDRPVFWLAPLKGRNSAIEAGLFGMENWGKPGATYALDNEEVKISEVSRIAAMRKKIGEGSATPEEIGAFEIEAKQKGEAGIAAMHKLVDTLLDRRHEPLYISGLWAQHMMIIERARERGIGDGEFHPKTIWMSGGGIKGVVLPPDYKEQVRRFYGEQTINPGSYGMTELAEMHPRCEAGRYHHAPGLIWLILDQEGERLLTARDGKDGIVEGRFAFLDLLYEGRWGGLITGDKVTVDFADRCPCGRAGPTLLDNITRYAQPGQDDHIGCAGTIDSYIRGSLGADA